MNRVSALASVGIVCLILAQCSTQQKVTMSWLDYGIAEEVDSVTLYETRSVIPHISGNGKDMIAAASLIGNWIILLELSSNAARLDSVGAIVLPLSGLEGVVRLDYGGSSLGIISERNVWRYDLAKSQVVARVRTFVPLADVEVMNDDEWYLTEYPVLNTSSLVVLSGDFGVRHRLSVLEPDERLQVAPSSIEFLMSGVDARDDSTLGLIAVSRGGILGRFGRLGVVGGLHRVIDLLPGAEPGPAQLLQPCRATLSYRGPLACYPPAQRRNGAGRSWVV